jgi:uncharacterized membrane protein YfcA
MSHPSFILLAGIGVVAGLLSGLFGIGGGIVIVPALIYLAGFDQHLATGTSLAILLPPVGIGAVVEYSRRGAVDFRAAIIVAIALLLAGWAGSIVANKMSAQHLRLAFGLFVIALGASVAFDAMRGLRWV